MLLKDPRDDIAFYVLACFHLFLSHGGKEMQQVAMTLIRAEGKELFKKIHGMLDRVQFHLRSQKYAMKTCRAKVQAQQLTTELIHPFLHRCTKTSLVSYV